MRACVCADAFTVEFETALSKIFARFDRDGDGAWSDKEFASYCASASAAARD